MKKSISVILLTSLFLGLPTQAKAIPVVLSDKIYGGSGVIDLFDNLTASELDSALTNGTLYVGTDLNEQGKGNEGPSVGVAIESFELVVSTASSDLSFSEFYTNTTSELLTAASPSGATYNTLFGLQGSNQINGGNMAPDDVVEIRNISLPNAGDITGAELRINFADTLGNGENETFFDFGGGFEDFAIITQSGASETEARANGITGAPTDITFSEEFTAPSGAPQPFLLVLLLMPLFAGLKGRGARKA